MPFTDSELDQARADAMNNLMQVLQRNVRVRYELDIDDLLPGSVVHLALMRLSQSDLYSVLPCLADDSSKETRACAYRLLRHVTMDLDSLHKLEGHGIGHYIVRSVQGSFVLALMP